MPPLPTKPLDETPITEKLWYVYVVSFVAACNAELVTYPFDLVKTRMQIQGENNKIENLGAGPKKGMLGTGINVVKQEGFIKLYSGYSAVCLRHLFYSGTRVLIYRLMRDKVFNQKKGEHFDMWKSGLCGIAGGVTAQFIANPADLVKIHFQMEGKRKALGLNPRVHSLREGLVQVYQVGGVKGLWRGCVPNMQRAALIGIGDISAYDVSKRYIIEWTGWPDNSLVHTGASFIAGLVAAVLATPSDVVKSRIMNQPVDDKGRGLLYSSSLDCLRKTVHAEGYAGLYRGFIPFWLRMTPWSFVFWHSYEFLIHFD